jgi:hypothetical protein
MMPGEVWDSTLGEINCLLEGYNKRVYVQKDLNRQLQYTMYCLVTEQSKRLEIFDVFPLEGDPTKEERDVFKRKRELVEQEKAVQSFERLKHFDAMMQEKFKKEAELKNG